MVIKITALTQAMTNKKTVEGIPDLTVLEPVPLTLPIPQPEPIPLPISLPLPLPLPPPPLPITEPKGVGLWEKIKSWLKKIKDKYSNAG